MTKTASKYHERNARKQSWLPLLAAIILPTIMYIGLKMFQNYQANMPVAETAAPSLMPSPDQFYLTVKLVKPDGTPLAGRQITFTHQGVGSEGTMAGRVTDAAGIAIFTTPAKGSILVQMDGRREPARIKDLDQGERFRTVEYVIADEQAP